MPILFSYPFILLCFYFLGLSELDISNNSELESRGLELLLKVRRTYISLAYSMKINIFRNIYEYLVFFDFLEFLLGGW